MFKHVRLLISFTALLTGLISTMAMAAEATPATIDAKTCEKPEYPRASLVNEETGAVTLAFLIGADGKVNDSKVEKSSGHKNLDKAALAGMGKCKFKPGMKDGKPEQAWAKVEYVWKLD